jgi:hypothetical protein
MVRLIQLPHLSDRVHGMLFQVSFAQNLDLLQKACLCRRASLMNRVLIGTIQVIAHHEDDVKQFSETLGIAKVRTSRGQQLKTLFISQNRQYQSSEWAEKTVADRIVGGYQIVQRAEPATARWTIWYPPTMRSATVFSAHSLD